MHTLTGLDVLRQSPPPELAGARVGLVCHAASIAADYTHCIDVVRQLPGVRLSAIFGPQHGLFGQTQDNMVEWEGAEHPRLKVPVHSLYGQTRKPTPRMMSGLDAMIIDLQDVGARPYTYIWTVKNCLEACAEAGIAVWVLDRPNPIAALDFDGPLLLREYFSFVGGAEIPLCHRMTLGELALLLRQAYVPSVDLQVVWMREWQRDSLWADTGLPWVLPSPNMPSPETAVVYPGMVLLEATNLSEGRGTTRPFEIIGAPFLDVEAVRRAVAGAGVQGCVIREHDFIPTFQKWHGEACRGLQVHVTQPRVFQPVLATAAALSAVIAEAPGRFLFKPPPYEYETIKMPFDILAGSGELRAGLEHRAPVASLAGQWREERQSFLTTFQEVAHYPERLP